MSTALALRSEFRHKLPATLSPQIRNAAELLLSQEPTAKSYTALDLRTELYRPMSAVAMLLGHSNSLAEGKDLQMMGTALAAVIHRRFPSFRMPEITEALVRGASGEWPLPNGFLAPTLPNFTHWLVCYQQQCRSEALKALQKVAEHEQQLRLPKPNYEADLPAAVAELAEHVRHCGSFPTPLDGGNLAYDWLKRIGAFSGFKTANQYADMMRKESIALTRTRPSDQSKRKQVASFAVLLRQGWPAQHPMAITVANNCKKRLLREWVRYHVARKTDLHTWLTELAAAVHPQSKAA